MPVISWDARDSRSAPSVVGHWLQGREEGGCKLSQDLGQTLILLRLNSYSRSRMCYQGYKQSSGMIMNTGQVCEPRNYMWSYLRTLSGG